MRKLAEQSREASEQIKERIAGIQHDTAEAVTAMQSGTAEVQAGSSAIREVGTQFEDITRMVGEINTQMSEMNGAIRRKGNGRYRSIRDHGQRNHRKDRRPHAEHLFLVRIAVRIE